jgi:hypothetical protein
MSEFKVCARKLTPVDTRAQGFPGATGVTENEKTRGFRGF